MSYHGMIDFKGSTLPCYEIFNNKINFNELKLIPATLKEYPIIQNMATYYSYDMSEYMGWAQGSDGTHSVGMDYIKYWQAQNTFPFIIKYQNELVGFVIIDKDVINPANDFNIAQFFILRKFKGKGIGQYIAFECFNQFAGNWEVFVMLGNEGAYRFWRHIIKKYTANQFKECTRTVGNSVRNIFEFNSQLA